MEIKCTVEELKELLKNETSAVGATDISLDKNVIIQSLISDFGIKS